LLATLHPETVPPDERTDKSGLISTNAETSKPRVSLRTPHILLVELPVSAEKPALLISLSRAGHYVDFCGEDRTDRWLAEVSSAIVSTGHRIAQITSPPTTRPESSAEQRESGQIHVRELACDSAPRPELPP